MWILLPALLAGCLLCDEVVIALSPAGLEMFRAD